MKENQEIKEEKIIWSLDLMFNLHNCKGMEFEEKSIKKLCQSIGDKIDKDGEIIGIVNNFGEHNESMKGLRIIHETQNSLITGHFIFKDNDVYLNVHSCSGYRPSEVIAIVNDILKPESYSCQKIFRE